jgi:hypothetical protein
MTGLERVFAFDDLKIRSFQARKPAQRRHARKTRHSEPHPFLFMMIFEPKSRY